MALVLKDRVVESSASSGTGTFTLDGAQSGYQSFAAIGNGNTTYYTIENTQTSEWEVGVGTYNANTLSRDTVLSSSNGGSLVDFSSGPKNVFVDLPSEKVAPTDALGTMAYQNANAVAITGGTISLNAGTVALPSLSTTGDTNTGIFFPAADTIAFTEGGTEAMRITNAGNVGIGTSGPTARLDVRGNVSIINSPEARIDVSGSTSNFAINCTDSDYATFASGGSSLGFGITYGSGLFICENATGRIGVGTDTPTTTLDVAGTGKFTAVTTPSVTAPTTDLTLNAVSTGAIKFVTAGGLQAQINNATTAAQYTLLARANASNTQKITAFGTASLALQSTGGGTISLRTGDETNTQVVVNHIGSAVNNLQLQGAATGVGETQGPLLSVQGSDGNINMRYLTKGAGSHYFSTNLTQIQFRIAHGAGTANNRLAVVGSNAGLSPILFSEGTDTDIDLALTPKGAGRIRFGAYTATILTPTGFIEIKDSGGTTRRLLVG